MIDLAPLITLASKTKNGFRDIEAVANEVSDMLPFEESYHAAMALLTSREWQARSLATFVLGRLSAKSPKCLETLQTKVSKDENWRVQEVLAKAFDRYCRDTGYENALPTIKQWLADPSPNTRRAVTEGLRIWTNRPFFKEHPDIAISMLAQFREDDSEYLRKSVGNALRDISKKHPELIRTTLQKWDHNSPHTTQVVRLASRFL